MADKILDIGNLDKLLLQHKQRVPAVQGRGG